MQREAHAPLAFGFVVALLMLIAGAILWALFAPAADQIFTTTADQTTNQVAADHQSTIETIWDNMAFYIAFVALLFVISRAYFESRRAV